MAPDTDSPKPEADFSGQGWSRRMSLTGRILAVNTLPLVMLAGSFFYLDGFRSRLVEERMVQATSEARLIAQAIGREDANNLTTLTDRMIHGDTARIRVIDSRGRVMADNWTKGRTFALRDPAKERWQRKLSFRIDAAIDWLVGAEVPPPFRNFEGELPIAGDGASLSLAPDRTHMIEARASVSEIPGYKVVTLRNARDIRRFVRAERTNLGYILGGVAILAVLLSLFLARTIVGPLRHLAEAALAVRFGQAREVEIPLLPSREDDIGKLAGAVADMTHALRTRMDAVESFAADVSHELKNPLASLASAVQSLKRVRKPEHKEQLEAIIEEDIQRLDRLITDISDLSRVDAHLARTRFQSIDMGELLDSLVKSWRDRKSEHGLKIALKKPTSMPIKVCGDASQLSRVIDNLIDNAISFSPGGGSIQLTTTREKSKVVVAVEDEGPGVPANARKKIFERFHSDRPSEQFGNNSGLGLSIVKAVVEAHNGSITATAREDGKTGARFVIELPAARK